MEETGVVIEIKDGRALVRMSASGGCEGCSAAGTCKAVSGERVLEADNSVGARPGQHVVLKIESGAFLKASFLVYMLPIIFLFAGAYLGGKIGPAIYAGLSPDYWQALVGALFLALSVIFMRLYEKKVKKGATALRPFIVRIMQEGEGGGIL